MRLADTAKGGWTGCSGWRVTWKLSLLFQEFPHLSGATVDYSWDSWSCGLSRAAGVLCSPLLLDVTNGSLSWENWEILWDKIITESWRDRLRILAFPLFVCQWRTQREDSCPVRTHRVEDTGNFINGMRQRCKRLRGFVPHIALIKEPQTPVGRRVWRTLALHLRWHRKEYQFSVLYEHWRWLWQAES